MGIPGLLPKFCATGCKNVRFENRGARTMTELLTAAQMRAIEQAAIASGEVTGLDLMERAGRGVVEAVFAQWPELAKTSHRAVVLCGPGNNGGDGFVVARLLKEWGWEVEVFLYGDPDKMPPDARLNYERWSALGDTQQFDLESYLKIGRPEVLFDAFFGTGLNRALSEALATAVDTKSRYHWKNWGSIRFVAIDCPTGLNTDNGDETTFLRLAKFTDAPDSHPTNRADLTVTFHSPKIGHYLAMGPSVCGKIKVVDIGLRGDALERCIPGLPADTKRVRLNEPGFLGRWLPQNVFPNPLLGKTGHDHKYDHGHALILSGGAGQTGAARLAARGCLRIGAGLVTLGVPPSAQSEVAAQVTSVMLVPVVDAGALAEVLEDNRINALCLGPGLGLDDEQARLVASVLNSGRPCVLDADALTLIARDAALFAAVHDKCVLTPHGGEFARLFPDIARRLRKEPRSGPAYSKVDATRDAAARAGCTILLKGPDTVIADPSGRCSINSAHYDRAAPWLATAGSGDVLAGFITGLLARGFAPMPAAETAAWLHVECALKFGPGLIAEDIPEMLPQVFRDLGI
jgi:hydroxyethylthiazole kinase-like uncharacterized protein yjeF